MRETAQLASHVCQSGKCGMVGSTEVVSGLNSLIVLEGNYCLTVGYKDCSSQALLLENVESNSLLGHDSQCTYIRLLISSKLT